MGEDRQNCGLAAWTVWKQLRTARRGIAGQSDGRDRCQGGSYHPPRWIFLIWEAKCYEKDVCRGNDRMDSRG